MDALSLRGKYAFFYHSKFVLEQFNTGMEYELTVQTDASNMNSLSLVKQSELIYAASVPPHF